jgi:CheY-like chemotaxis protein
MLAESPMRIKPLIFAMDGDSDFFLAIRELLEDESYVVQMIPIAEQPFANIVRAQPDLLLIDLPYHHDEHAWTLLAHLDEHPVTRLIPAIALSTDPGNLIAFTVRAGAANRSTTLLKPFELELFLATVDEILPAPARMN